MTTQNVTIPALSGGSFSAYLAAPNTQPDAGIVLIQEILGVNTNMRQIAELAHDRTLAFLKQHLGSGVKV